MSIFNPKLWVKEEIQGIRDDTLVELDNRYINTGENVLDQSINNLNLVNLNISTTGRIYFNGDNTIQTTAYNPISITNAINDLKNQTNTFTGTNNFTNLNITDTTGNQTEIRQDSNYLRIENKVNNGFIEFITTSGTKRTVSIDMFGNLSGINDVNSSKIKTSQMILNNTIFFSQSGQNCVFQNNNIFGEYQWRTKTGTGNDGWVMGFNPNGQLYGMNNLVTHSIETKYLNFRDPSTFQLTGSQIYQSGSDIIIDNANTPGTFKLKHKTNDNVQNMLFINEFMNITGVNDLTIKGKLGLNNDLIIHKFENNAYIIDNKTNSSNIQIRNYDTNGILRQINLDQYMNMSGVNDLYVQRIFLNNVLFNPSLSNDVITKTRNLYSYNQNQTSIEYNNGRFLFLPGTTVITDNPIIKTSDNALIGYNIAQINNNAISICVKTATKTGIRATSTKTELYLAKVMDNLQFSDDTVQTTAMTESYLTSIIQNVINQMNIVNIIPVGTILAYGGVFFGSNGPVNNPPPTGYLWCYGDQVLQSSYGNLYNTIYHNYSYGKPVSSGMFYLPDLRGAVLKGTQYNPNFTYQTTTTQLGEIQQCNVGRHSHLYRDRGEGSRTVASGTGATIANNTNNNFWTDGKSYESDSHVELDLDTRSNSISINYIIKF
jgi:microcystin-dependent protein